MSVWDDSTCQSNFIEEEINFENLHACGDNIDGQIISLKFKLSLKLVVMYSYPLWNFSPLLGILEERSSSRNSLLLSKFFHLDTKNIIKILS